MKLDFGNARYWTNLTFCGNQPLTTGQQRYARILQATFASLAGRGVAVVVGLISVPLTVGYLGAERYGLWVTLSAALAWLSIADLGLGNGLTNALSQCYGRDRPDLAQHYVATAFWMLVCVAGALAATFTLAWPWIDWPKLFNVNTLDARTEVGPAMALAVAIFIFSFPLSLVVKIYGAYQEGAIANYWATAGNVVSLLALISVTRVEGGLVWLVGAISGSLLTVTAINAAWLFLRHKPWLVPRPSAVRRESMRGLVGTGGMFFVLQVETLLILQTDNLIIAHFLGADQVAPYSVAWRLFSYTSLFQVLVFPSLWPAYAEAVACGDVEWIRQTFRVSIVGSTLLTLALVFPLVFFGRRIIELWAGADVIPPQALLVWMGCWSVINVMTSAMASILNGSGEVRRQVIYGGTTAVVNLALSVTLVQPFGITGVIAATVIAHLVCNVVPGGANTALVFRKLSMQRPGSGSVIPA